MDYTLVPSEGDTLALGRTEKPLTDAVLTGRFQNPAGEGATGAEMQQTVEHLDEEGNPHNLELATDTTVMLATPTPEGFAIVLKDPIRQGGAIFKTENGSNVITVGAKAYVFVPYDGIITDWELTGDLVGDVEVDILKGSFADYPLTVANSICNTQYPKLINAIKSQGDLTGWSTDEVTAGDYLQMYIRSANLIRKLTLILKVMKGTP
jgi:hypothetical protein